MRFLPTVNLWDPAMYEAVASGRLVLQTGQWVRCGSGRPSRFVLRKSSGVLWVMHPDDKGISNSRFSETVKVWKGV